MFDDAPSQPSSSSSKKDFDTSAVLSKLPMVIGVVLVVVAIGAAGFFYMKYQSEKTKAAQLLGASTTQTPQQIKELVDKVGKLVELPNETPTVATVSDPAKLSGQAFFEKTKTGDLALIFEKARIAVLYRPSENKIINYATNITSGAPTPEPSGPETSITPEVSPTSEPTVAPTVQPSSGPTNPPAGGPTIAPIQ